MNEFVEKNKGFLNIYCMTAQVSGLLLVVAPIVGILIGILTDSISMGRPHIPNILRTSYAIQSVVLNFVFLGLVALGVAQFIKYVFARQLQPTFLLRIGDKILYAYAGLLILGAILTWVFQMVAIKATAMPTFIISFAGLLLPAAVKALILIGLGKILKRVIPVIEESKTLV